MSTKITPIRKTAAGRRAVPDNEFCIELKMRVFDDVALTVELARRAEQMGIGLLSIHGRTHSERDDPVRESTIKVSSFLIQSKLLSVYVFVYLTFY